MSKFQKLSFAVIQKFEGFRIYLLISTSQSVLESRQIRIFILNYSFIFVKITQISNILLNIFSYNYYFNKKSFIKYLFYFHTHLIIPLLIFLVLRVEYYCSMNYSLRIGWRIIAGLQAAMRARQYASGRAFMTSAKACFAGD